MKVLKNYLWNMLYQVFVIIVPIFTIPYLSRILGPSGVGINSYTNSIAQYFILFGSIGINIYGNRQIAYVRSDEKEMSQTFWEIFFLRIITMLIATFAYIVCITTWGKYSVYFWGQIIQVLAAAFDISWFFMGLENFRVTVLRNIVVKIISLILIFTLVKSQSDTLTYIVLIGASTLIGNLTLFTYLRSHIVRPVLRNIKLVKHLTPAIVLFIPQIAIQVYVVFNRTVLGQMISVEASGFYDNSDKIVKIMLAITTALGSVLLPHIAHEYSKKNFDKIHQIFYKSFDIITLITVPMAFGLAAISYRFCILFFGVKFAAVGSLMQIESIASIFMSWAYAIGNQYLLPTDQTKKYTISVSVGAIVSIICSAPLIKIMGINGSMLATLFAEISVTTFMIISIRHKLNLRLMFKHVLKYWVVGIIMYCVIRIFDSQLNTTWLSIIIEILIGIVVYSIGISIFRFDMILDTLKTISNRIKK